MRNTLLGIILGLTIGAVSQLHTYGELTGEYQTLNGGIAFGTPWGTACGIEYWGVVGVFCE